MNPPEFKCLFYCLKTIKNGIFYFKIIWKAWAGYSEQFQIELLENPPNFILRDSQFHTHECTD